MGESRKSFPFKKIIGVLAGFLGLLFLFLATAPLWFDVDKYRPQIVSAAQPFINGTLSVGKLSLSLWGKIKVKVDGLEIRDAQSEKAVGAKSIYLEVPVASLFSAEPDLTLVMDKPQISAVKDRAGKINLLKLIREEAKIAKEPNNVAKTGVTAASAPVFIARARLNLQLRQAQLSYLDRVKNQRTDIKDIALRLKIDARNQKGHFTLEIPGMQLDGKVRLESVSQPAGTLELSSKLIDYGQWSPNGSSAIKLSDLESEIKFKANLLNLSSLTFKVLGGQGKAAGTVSFTNPLPSYDFTVALKSVDLNQAAASQSEIFRNTLRGIADFQMTGRGEGFDPIFAKKHLQGSGTLLVKEAKFSTINVGQMLEKGLGESLVKVIEKVPVLRGKPISKMGPLDSEYEVIKSDFKIQNGIFESPNFEAVAREKKGVDLKGSTQLNLETCAINANWRVVDTYNLTKVRDISVDEGGVKIEHILAEGNGPVSFPVQVEGTCGAPKMNYEAMASALIKVALQNASRGMVQKAKQEISKKIGEELQKGAAKPIQDALKGIFGK